MNIYGMRLSGMHLTEMRLTGITPIIAPKVLQLCKHVQGQRSMKLC